MYLIKYQIYYFAKTSYKISSQKINIFKIILIKIKILIKLFAKNF